LFSDTHHQLTALFALIALFSMTPSLTPITSATLCYVTTSAPFVTIYGNRRDWFAGTATN